MENYTRELIAKTIYNNLINNKLHLQNQFLITKDKIIFFYLDNLLPIKLAIEIQAIFPKSGEMKLKKNIRESKYIGVQMNLYHLLLEETILFF